MMKGNTPKKGSRNSKGDNTHITSRIIGVEVHCGPIHGTFLYYTDNLVSGGANIIIEVTRQAILDLQDLLKEKKDHCERALDVPDYLILQFDNCGENKNKFVFAYFSLLVQDRHFRVVEVFFLIVGHTHASIDQYFSILSKLIWSSEFVGSPLALEALLKKEGLVKNLSGKSWEKGAERAKPLIVRKLSVVYDMKTALNPLINKTIKYYPIPHRFRFELYHNVCAMQYSLFSTHQTLLPLRPEKVPDLSVEDTLDCEINFLSLVGGEEAFLKACGATALSNPLSRPNQEALKVNLAIICNVYLLTSFMVFYLLFLCNI